MSVTDDLTITLIIILSVDLIMFLGQGAMTDMNPTGTQFHDYSGSMLEHYDSEHTINFTNMLPDAQQSVGIEGDSFTDTFLTAKSWVTSVANGIFVFFTAPVDILVNIGTPGAIVSILKAFWVGITLFLVGAFLLGRT